MAPASPSQPEKASLRPSGAVSEPLSPSPGSITTSRADPVRFGPAVSSWTAYLEPLECVSAGVRAWQNSSPG
jgi:hypothetical protein